jgi:hypothetical protein
MHLPSEKRVLTKIQLESKGGSMDFLEHPRNAPLLLCNITLSCPPLLRNAHYFVMPPLHYFVIPTAITA